MISSVYSKVDEAVAEDVFVDQLQSGEAELESTFHDTDREVESTLHDTEVLSTLHDADM